MAMHNPPHPGEALREDVLTALGLDTDELAKLLGYPLEELRPVLSCCAPVSVDLARRLELAGLGTARVYLAQQVAYDLWHAS